MFSGTAQAKASPVDREKTETLQGVIKQVGSDVLVRVRDRHSHLLMCETASPHHPPPFMDARLNC